MKNYRANIPANLNQYSKILSGVSKYWKAPVRNDGAFYSSTILATKVIRTPGPPPYFASFFLSLPISGLLIVYLWMPSKSYNTILQISGPGITRALQK